MITIDFAAFDKKGLKDLIAKFKKAALPIQDVVADNKAKREAGYQIKTATLTFESGQILVLKVKADGGLYQAKLNGKILAIKNYIKADTFTDEVLAYVKENEPNYLKQKEKAMARQKVVVPKIKPVNTTIAEQSQQLQNTLTEFQGLNEAAQNQLAEVNKTVEAKGLELDGLATQLKAENDKSVDLQKKLENARQGIFESASLIDREAIAKELSHGTGRHPELTAKFVEKYKNSISINDAIEFVGGFSDTQLLALLKKEESITEDAGEVGEDNDPETTYAVNSEPVGDNLPVNEIIATAPEPGPQVVVNDPVCCPKCNANMEPCDAGMNCPVCGCKVDPDGMILEAINPESDQSGYHDINDPQHIDDPDHENNASKAVNCPWCGSDVREGQCIACNRKYAMALADREAWMKAVKSLPADDFPANYE